MWVKSIIFCAYQIMALINSLNLLTWNVTGVMSSASYLSDILGDGDINVCGISEHWLTVDNMYFLDSIHSRYDYVGTVSKGIGQRGHGQGGVAIMWHKRLSPFVVPLDVDDERIVGIQVQANRHYLYIFQVYLPCSNHSIRDYRQCLLKLFELYNTYSDNGTCIIMGDFNANVIRCTLQPRDRDLLQFINDCSLCAINLLDTCYGSPYSFVSYDDLCYSMIDYVLLPKEILDLIIHCEIATDHCLNVSRHKPILFCLDCNIAGSVGNVDTTQCVNWRRVNATLSDQYCMLVNSDSDIQTIGNNELDEWGIVSSYHKLCNKLTEYSQIAFPQKSYKPFTKPYWTTELNNLHGDMVKLREDWCRAGRPRDPDIQQYQQYKNGKAVFRRAHRRCVLQYMSSLDSDLESAARTNSARFWKLIKTRRGKYRSTLGAGIRFNGQMYRGREDLCEQWAKYFCEIYKPSTSPSFDETWKQTVCDYVRDYFDNATPEREVCVSSDLVSKCINSLPKGKVGGADGLMYEHLKYCVSVISQPLSNLYTQMLRRGHIPIDMKKGEIITLHKGGKKDKSNPDNYRAITLSSVILKVYEMVILDRCERHILSTLSRQQGGFQKQLGCEMTSFVLHETIHYARENSSKVYVCFLDAKKAFDNVWLDGLFYKLILLNIDMNTMIAIQQLYDGASCNVKYSGLQSDSFPVLQGTRQGGKSSPLMYLVFIDGLIKALEQSQLGVCLYNVQVSSPTVADDMTLLSFSKSGLEQMLDICYEYASTWRYFYNPDKCAVITFNDSRRDTGDNIYKFGSDSIQQKDHYVHLGIACDKNLSSKMRMREAGIKLRGSYMNVLHNGIKSENVSPKVLRTIYVTEIIPKALYGCEHWTVYSKRDISELETAHRYCIKHMQRLSKFSHSEYAQTTADIPPIQVLIDKRKLLMLGQLCRLPCEYMAKQLFVNRLISYHGSGQHGFIPDIYQILAKYNLRPTFDEYVTNGNFPSKQSWKRLVKQSVDAKWKQTAVVNLNNTIGRLSDTGVIRTDGVSILWDIVSQRPELKVLCCRVNTMISMMITRRNNWKCSKCDRLTGDLVSHLLLFCDKNQEIITMLQNVMMSVETIDQYCNRIRQPIRTQCEMIIKVAIQLITGKLHYPTLLSNLNRIVRQR